MSETDKQAAYQALFGAVLGSEAVWIVDIGLRLDCSRPSPRRVKAVLQLRHWR